VNGCIFSDLFQLSGDPVDARLRSPDLWQLRRQAIRLRFILSLDKALNGYTGLIDDVTVSTKRLQLAATWITTLHTPDPIR
jgi:hypothetical protein